MKKAEKKVTTWNWFENPPPWFPVDSGRVVIPHLSDIRVAPSPEKGIVLLALEAIPVGNPSWSQRAVVALLPEQVDAVVRYLTSAQADLRKQGSP